MKVLVVHDQQGKIKSVTVPAAPEPGFEMRLGLKSRPDEIVSEVEVGDLQRDKIHEHMQDIVTHFQIADHASNPKLVKK